MNFSRLNGCGCWSLALLLMIAASGSYGQSKTAKLTVETIADNGSSGVVRVALWKSEAGFPKGEPFKGLVSKMVDGKATTVFSDLEPGDYAISAFWDKNNNGKLDENLVTKPTEPYGFSNDVRHAFGPAKFQEALLKVCCRV